MSTFNTVIAGIDGSDVANEALKFAAAEAARRGAKLLAVHVGDRPREGEPPTDTIVVHEYAEIVRTEAVATVADLYPGVLCETMVREGDAARVLVELSQQADLVVVGTHRMGRMRGFVLGSVSQRVAAHARCPVVAISGLPIHDDGRVVLGASATIGGLAAMRFACEEARTRKTSVHIVRAMIIEDWSTIGFGYPMTSSMYTLEDSARAVLDTIVKTARNEFPDVQITSDMPREDEYVALLKASEDAAMLVVGSRRNLDAELPHLGPVSAWLLHQAQCPLAIVSFTQPVTEAVSIAEGGSLAATT